MEVLVGGSTLGIEVGSASAFVRERAAAAAAAAQAGDDSDAGFGAGRSGKLEEEDSSSSKSSSIGAPDDSDEEEGEVDGVVSSEDAKGGFRKGGFGSFGSLASLEDSLPIKRGLSNHFSGKSKSFNNLSEANLTEVVGSSSARDLEKPEHPFNKKRRILRWSKNFSLLSTAKSMPLFPLSEEEEDDDAALDHREGDEGDDHGGGGDGGRGKSVAAASRFSGGRHGKKHRVFKSSSCFALSDLHEEDEEEADEDEEDEEDGGN